MQPAIEVDGHSLDRVSQLLVLELGAAGDEELPLTTGELAAAVDATNQKVLYRMDSHLLPAGWVEEGAHDREARCFRLTDAGHALLDDHREAIQGPRTVEEACEAASDARAAVDELRDRVGAVERTVDDRLAATGDLDDLRSTVDDLEEHIARLEDDLATAVETAETADERSSDLEDRLAAAERDHSEVRDVAKELYEDAKRTRAVRTAGLLGRLRWLLTGAVPEE